MKFWRKVLLAIAPLAAGLIAGGCSGVNASHSVSPASFFLPGIMSTSPELKTPGAKVDPEIARAQGVETAVGQEAGQP